MMALLLVLDFLADVADLLLLDFLSGFTDLHSMHDSCWLMVARLLALQHLPLAVSVCP